MTRPDKKYDVFINYSFKDVLAVNVLMARLQAHGIHCWRDEWEMLPGDDIVTSLREGIEESHILLVFVGRNGLGPWQKREILSAKMAQRFKKNKHIIPVFFPGPSKEEREKLADFLQNPLGVEFGHLDEKAPFEKLLKSIQGKLLMEEPGREFLPCNDGAPPWKELQNPYKGLSKFLEGDVERFFGREKATAAMIENIERVLSAPGETRLFVLAGASGCGKSSLAHAGLMAGLKRKWGDTWRYATVDHPGNNPLYKLATEMAGDTWRNFEAQLHEDLRALDSKMSQSLPGGSEGKYVLLVDQFEEVFTLCEDAEKCRSFMANLLFAASKNHGRGIVLLTLRSEFWQSFMDAVDDVEEEKKACNGKAELLKNSSIKHVAPMSREELQKAIEWPAQQMGVGYDSILLEKLLEDAGAVRKDKGAREGILPLLQVVLQELWQFRSPNHIGHEAYKETGGIRGALEKCADNIYGRLDKAEQGIAQHIFLNLLRMNPDAPETRKQMCIDAFAVKGHDKKEVAKVVERLVDGRLLVSDKGEAEIIHETLIHHWGVLRHWVESNREGLKRKQQIEDRAKLWQSASGDLLTGNTLAAALAWEEEDAASAVPLGLNAKAREFLEASQKRQEEERAKETARLRRQRIVYAVSAAVMAVLLVIAAFMWKESDRQRVVAEKQRTEAKQQRTVAEVRRLASSALLEQNKRVDLSLLLAMASIQEMEAIGNPALAESESALLSTFQLHPKLGSSLREHTEAVNSLEFSPDGRVLASASIDKTIILWDVKKHQKFETLREHTGSVMHLAFSPDGSLLASASEDNTVILWDVKQPQKFETLRGHNAGVKHLSFSPDGSLLASASEDKIIILWDVKRQQSLAILRGHEDRISHLAFSLDGRVLASASADETVILWDMGKQKISKTLRGHKDWVNHLSFSPDGRVLASANYDGELILWDVKEQRILTTLSKHGVNHLSFSPDGSLLASASWDNTVILWDVKKQQKLEVLRGHGGGVYHLSFSPDGRMLASASDDKTVILWELKQQSSLASLSGHDSLVNDPLSFSPDGSLLASTSYHGTLILWDVKKQQKFKTLQGHKGEVNHLSFSPDGRVLASASDDKTVILWDVEKQKVSKMLHGHEGEVNHLSFSPDGSLLASTSKDNTIILWDVKQQQALGTLRGHKEFVHCVSFSPDGGVLTSIGKDNTIIRWDVKRQQVLATLHGQADWLINYPSCSPDGSLLASAYDETIILWDVKKQQTFGLLRGHEGEVNHLSFSPDGSLLASASKDKTVILWDVKQQHALATLRGHGDYVRHLSFSPDGSLLASAGDDEKIKLWDVSRTSWRERARRIANRNMTREEWSTHMGERPYRKIFEDLPGPLD